VLSEHSLPAVRQLVLSAVHVLFVHLPPQQLASLLHV
jgi:hypothetical protein